MMLNTKDILISIQRALLEKVTPNLRFVNIVPNNNYTIEVYFYYNQNPSEEEEELASLAHTEVVADYPSPQYRTNYYRRVLPYPEKMSGEGYCVYHRYEPELD